MTNEKIANLQFETGNCQKFDSCLWALLAHKLAVIGECTSKPWLNEGLVHI